MVTVYIGLGSNLAEPILQVGQAVAQLANLAQVELLVVSSLYRSSPMGPAEQPDYINAVAKLATSLPAEVLLDALQHLELQAGRIRKSERWGARVLDLDVLLYGDQIISTKRLTVPHYGMQQREFVLLPLAEIAPELVLPDGAKVAELAHQIPRNGLARLPQAQ
jgi:2-amino-4-hydroxy-6-hydroxymethyldihydropteridine diphosphokinase